MADEIFGVVGLGNPGSDYERSRHNAGFWVVHCLASGQRDLQVPWPERETSTWKDKYNNLFSKSSVGGAAALLVLPQRYMNRSGEAAVPLLNYFRIPPERTIVIYDELDLDPGAVRVRQGGSSESHGGIRDLVEKLGTDQFIRIRLGIGHPRRAGLMTEPADWVLAQPSGDDVQLLARAVGEAAGAVEEVILNGIVAAQGRYNRRQK